MSRRTRRRARAPLAVPEALVTALEQLHGPLASPAATRELARGMAALHQGLTRERTTFLTGPRYLADAQLRRAYGTAYVAINAPKLAVALDRLAAGGDLPAGPLRCLELGAGPGTGLAGLGLWARERGVALAPMWVTDAVPANLEAAQRLADALKLKARTAVVDAARPIAAQLPQGIGTFDLLLAMNVVNELPPGADALWVAAARTLLAPGGVVLCIEPAAVESSRRALALRDALVAAGFEPRFPCPHALPCPALARPDDWCHAAWPLARPAFLEAADAALGLRRDLVQATVFALRAPGGAPSVAIAEDRRRARLVSDPAAQKGRVRVRACMDDGTLATLERQTRDAKNDVADLAEASLHALWTFGGAEVVGDALRLRPDADPRPVDEGDGGLDES